MHSEKHSSDNDEAQITDEVIDEEEETDKREHCGRRRFLEDLGFFVSGIIIGSAAAAARKRIRGVIGTVNKMVEEEVREVLRKKISYEEFYKLCSEIIPEMLTYNGGIPLDEIYKQILKQYPDQEITEEFARKLLLRYKQGLVTYKRNQGFFYSHDSEKKYIPTEEDSELIERKEIYFKPPRKNFEVSEKNDFPYSFSPVLRYIEREKEVSNYLGINFDEQRIKNYFDNVCDETVNRLLAKTGKTEEEFQIMLDKLKSTPDGMKMIIITISEAFLDSGIRYGEESLMQRAFAEDNRNVYHLDCDLLSHGFAHIGYKLNLPVYEVPAPFHKYIQIGDQCVETTAFRDENTNQVGNVLTTHNKVREGLLRKGISWSDKAERQIKFFNPQDEEKLKNGIESNIFVGILDLTENQPEKIEKSLKYYLSQISADAPLLLTNFYVGCGNLACRYMEEKNYEKAKKYALLAVSIQRDQKYKDVLLKKHITKYYVLWAEACMHLGEEENAKIGMNEVRRIVHSGEGDKRSTDYIKACLALGNLMADEDVKISWYKESFNRAMEAFNFYNNSILQLTAEYDRSPKDQDIGLELFNKIVIFEKMQIEILIYIRIVVQKLGKQEVAKEAGNKQKKIQDSLLKTARELGKNEEEIEEIEKSWEKIEEYAQIYK